MANTQAGMINTTLSMMIVDAGKMPPNLTKTSKEDYPESSFRIVAYDGQNVLPTALGYRSYFSEQTKFPLPELPSEHVQVVLTYQDVEYNTYFIALCEEGAYICNATESASWSDWIAFAATGNNPTSGIRHLWTYAVVANQLYIYSQGQPAYFIIADPTFASNNVNQTIIKGATVTSVGTYSGFALLRVTPNFINMAGQIGLFRADQRLGFWDSENSVAWSSATQTWDFAPSTTTFSSITKFAAVIGPITKVLGHGIGFIIYSTRSIVYCRPTGSNELYSGSAIMGQNGVVFDTQIAAAQPDSVHYAITGGGLCRVADGVATLIEPEVSDYIVERSSITGIDVVDSRYLFIHSTDDFAPSVFSVDQERLPDLGGNYYTFKPSVTGPYPDVPTMLTHVLDGSDSGVQMDFTAVAQADDSPAVVNPSDKGTIPCYTGETFSTNMDETVKNAPESEFYVYVYSQIDLTKRYELKMGTFRPLFTSYYYEADGRFIDKAAEEFVQNWLTPAMDKIRQTIDLIVSSAEYFRPVRVIEFVTNTVESNTAQPVGYTKVSTYDMSSDLDWTWFNLMYEMQVDVKKSSCGLYLDGIINDVDYTSEVEITEQVQTAYIIDTVLKLDSVTTTYYDRTTSSDHVDTIDVDVVILRALRKVDSVFGYIPMTADAVTYMNAVYNGSFALKKFTPFTEGGVGYPAKPTTVNYITRNVAFEIEVETITDPTTERGAYGRYYNVAYALGAPDPSSSAVNYQESHNDTFTPCGSKNTVVGGNADAVPYLTNSRTILATASTVYGEQDFYGQLIEGVCHPELPLPLDGRAWGGAPFGVWSNDIEPVIPTPEELAGYYDELPKNIVLQDIVITMTATPRSTSDTPRVFKAEISGYGYQPSGGFSFRKTSSRNPSSPCNALPTEVHVEDPSSPNANYNNSVIPNLDTSITKYKPTNPGDWNYPQPIPLPNTSALFKKGTPTPFYPIWKGAVVWDMLLQKWGRYSNDHQVIYGLLPTNRVDATVMPVDDLGMRAGAFVPADKSFSFFTQDTNKAMITYGKIGKYRLGLTTGTKAIAQFGAPFTGNLIIELADEQGQAVDPTRSISVPLVDAPYAEIDFTEVAKWFNIRLEGQFDLVYLSFESAATARR